jgi:spore coat polysaccharide biosynthesis predicted glycosyltransferase SpsG
VDAGAIPGLAFGHLSRCLLIARKLEEMFGTEIILVMRDYPEGVSFARKSAFEIKIIPTSCDDEDTFLVEFLDERRPEWLVADLPYDTPFDYFRQVQSRGCKVAFIDDWRFRNPGADVYVNNSILSLERVAITPEASGYYLGPEYFIFDESQVDPNCRPPVDQVAIAISFGGADPTNLTESVIATLVEMENAACRFSVVLGPGYKHARRISEMVEFHTDRFRILVGQDNIIPIFQDSHCVICAGGRTAYELLTLGKPFLPIASTEFEARTIAKLLALHVIRYGLTSWNAPRFLRSFPNLLSEMQPILV